MDTIGGWSQADLRRFIVNNVLSDPGAFPKQQAQQQLPRPASNGDVPVWDASSSSWVTSSSHPIPPTELALPSDAAMVLNGLGAWAKGLTRIYDNLLSSATASIDTGANGVTQGFAHLLVVGAAIATGAAATNVNLGLRVNGDAANYQYIGSAAFQSSIPIASMNQSTAASEQAGFVVLIPNYTQAGRKVFAGFYVSYLAGSGSTVQSGLVGGRWHGAGGAITQLQFVPSANNIDIGSRVTIYGLG